MRKRIHVDTEINSAWDLFFICLCWIFGQCRRYHLRKSAAKTRVRTGDPSAIRYICCCCCYCCCCRAVFSFVAFCCCLFARNCIYVFHNRRDILIEDLVEFRQVPDRNRANSDRFLAVPDRNRSNSDRFLAPKSFLGFSNRRRQRDTDSEILLIK